MKKLFKSLREGKIKTKPIEKNIMRDIGYILLKLNNNDYTEVYSFLDTIGIVDVTYLMNVVYISLKQPGLLIGKKGEIIDFLTQELRKIHGDKLSIVLRESDIDQYLYPIDPIDPTDYTDY